ncbi:hypothetical protein HG535_0D02150 [Zygotorulaspora mrakii]|uniref:Carbonic anhydrase n=1 Tax=Zygotorulaspora mrakii TaxID=42260 RepID=A0A7H9B1Y8_ZYGMR|nr:uncharacterized protein HG535_0D02150 [Zygotorulaspora mrakii]QLG72507.1 hypothetical protein HG535_0D02150 [Zygotorulaspora mrakii]
MISDSPFTLSHDSKLDDLLQANKLWAQQMNHVHPSLFPEFNGKGQQPHTLFIGCSDSRYNETCLGVLPGEVFTWKTVANICSHKDLSFKATLEFAIRCLKVNKVVICGHTDCGGIKTCLTHQREPLRENKCEHLHEYLQDIDDLYHENKSSLKRYTDLTSQSKYLSQCNVARQFNRVMENETVQEAVQEGILAVYGLLYNVDSGLLEKVTSN